MRVSAKADYAVRAVVQLAVSPDTQPVKGDVIAEEQGIPIKFLKNILAELTRAGIVGSQRGAAGGYWLDKPADTVTVADIIRATDGPLADVRGQRPEALEYRGAASALREVWIATRANLRAVLEHVTVADIANGKLPASVTRLVKDPEAWARR